MQKTTSLAVNSTATRLMANSNGVCVRVISLLICALSIVSCEPDIPMVGLGIDDVYTVPRMRTLILHPEFEGEAYYWRMGDSIISTQRDLVFCEAQAGNYEIQLEIEDHSNPVNHTFTIVVWEEEVAYSPYISRVLEYKPAPGQFINVLPEYEEGDDYTAMLRKAENAIVGTQRSLISLGGWGGYVTFAFDHSVVNVPGAKDIIIEGNSFYASASSKSGSCEPGIVMVSIDVNQNGLPDDPFYELVGSEYHHPATIHDYEISYHRCPADHIAQPNKQASLTDTAYIRWVDNQGYTGYLTKNTFHTQDYFPQWLSDSILHFSGSRLPKNAYDKTGKGFYWVLEPFAFGYVDNHPNDSMELCSFDIDWAVDEKGKKVYLPCADFIRVYTGVHQQCGWIGETSTEIGHARDLHL